ncbi:ABC-type transport system involved in multi-copper enzyme maturation permease subunit [Saccharomonospora amisosensis]|uniref:ABC-type transport system involved in multi-copper enzyme maturation permease subunit n=1 Tax=Saccharomonospora amisosensis TaxID=1128677 RepID=A0A7X5USP5_9PSEU|nr:DUF4383 domain-containing protein [Saccharomonospora amisosensis]NIJ13519.1 ABC-type transport system involved in multi-copper enzyme maturation permease subunit [Saccharomonospora amisosensis]
MTRSPTETRVSVRGLQPVQVVAGLVGLIYLALGIIGLVISGFGDFTASTHSTMWIFSVNPLHNVVHLGVGLLGVLMALNSGLARTYGWVLFVAFGLLFVWGLAITGVFTSNPVSGLGNPLAIDTADTWLHFGTAIAGLLIAVMPARKVVEHVGTQPTEPTEESRGSERGGAHRRLWRRGTAH